MEAKRTGHMDEIANALLLKGLSVLLDSGKGDAQDGEPWKIR